MRRSKINILFILIMTVSLFFASCGNGVVVLGGPEGTTTAAFIENTTSAAVDTTTAYIGDTETTASAEATDTESDVTYDTDAQTDTQASTAETTEKTAKTTAAQTTYTEPETTKARVIDAAAEFSFLACPDNIIHPSVYYDCIKKAAEKKGVTPDYSKLTKAEGAEYDFAALYTNVAKYIKNADLSYVNVETMMGGEENGISGYPMFNTPDAAGYTLMDLGFDIYNLAHNHMLDSGNDKYLKNCAKFFKNNGKTTIGYYENESATNDLPIFECKGIKVAVLPYTFSTNGITLSSSSSTYIPYANDSFMKKQIDRAKTKADLVFISMHWGSEDTYSPNSEQRRVAQELCDWGVDAIIGMHPHVIQPMKWVTNANGKKTLVVYSLGNFISGQQDGFNLLGGMLSLNVYRDKEGNCGIKDVKFIPVITHYIKTPSIKQGVDTGHREYKLYLLKDYTEELAAEHGVHVWEKSHKLTLVGGKFSRETLIATVKQYIPGEFLSSDLG